MKYLSDEYTFTYEKTKSKFIAYLMPYSKFNEVMQRLKIEHSKARHYVYAYRYLNEFDQVVENCSDDGEPKGTSGKPSLAVMAGNELIDSAVIIVRYFGGTKLGTGGLVRAYSDAVNSVINESTLFEYKKLCFKEMICSYAELSKIEYLLNQEHIIIINKEFTTEVILKLQASKVEFENLILQIPNHIKLS